MSLIDFRRKLYTFYLYTYNCKFEEVLDQLTQMYLLADRVMLYQTSCKQKSSKINIILDI